MEATTDGKVAPLFKLQLELSQEFQMGFKWEWLLLSSLTCLSTNPTATNALVEML